MTDPSALHTIGQLARRTGLSVRTIRFWSDAGVVAPTTRSAGGYRLYDAEALARLELVRTLRDLGLDLSTVRAIVTGQADLRAVVRAQVAALDAEARTLRLRRAVLASVARRGSTSEELRIMHRLARLSADERQRMIDEFVAGAFAGIDPEALGGHLAEAMRRLPADLPDDPSDAQVDAWLELAELVGDRDFRDRVRQMALAGAAGAEAAPGYDPAAVTDHAGAALAAGVAPDSAGARKVVARIVGGDLPAAEAARIGTQVERFTDRRVERYWQLLGTLHGRPPFPSAVPAFEWFAAALRAHR